MDKYFVVQILHIDGQWTNTVHVKDDLDAALHQKAAFESTYMHGVEYKGNVADYSAVYVHAPNGSMVSWLVDDRTPKPEPEPEE